ncbi:hypothetical protein GOODEAATRI_005783 [Goodea atripinnis]|uniref:Uncharacterized protein n=1 Tax=Goodea atripinnis TaxID=208336 RepID=A0ABV0PBL8_9TELE
MAAWSFVLLIEFYPLPFYSSQTINRTTSKRDRLTQRSQWYLQDVELKSLILWSLLATKGGKQGCKIYFGHKEVSTSPTTRAAEPDRFLSHFCAGKRSSPGGLWVNSKKRYRCRCSAWELRAGFHWLSMNRMLKYKCIFKPNSGFFSKILLKIITR